MTRFSVTAVSQWMLHWRARRLPPPLAERLLEEWLGEAQDLARLPRLAFAVSVLLTRTSTLVRADAGEDRPREGAIISFDDVLVPATEQPTLAAAFLLDLFWMAPLALLVLWTVDLPQPYYLFELVVLAAVLGIVASLQIARYGGSFGMLVMKLRLVTLDGGLPRVRHLVVRFAPMLVFPTALASLAMLGVANPFRGLLACAAHGAWVAACGGNGLSGTMVIYAVPRVVTHPDQ
jgi:uncharacterized RDD family membrane protein YckC